jgi:GNAT superfamily N-acetyltransferase
VTRALRLLRESDWPIVFREIWHPIVHAGGTYLYPRDTGEVDARALWCLPAPARVWVVLQDGELVATAQLRPNQPGAGSHVANAAFMVAPAKAGAGLGRWTAVRVLDEARRAGYTAMQFNAVVADNAAAVVLWRSLGFAVVGRVPDGYRDADRSDDLLIMHRVL